MTLMKTCNRLFSAPSCWSPCPRGPAGDAAKPGDKVSYYTQVRPIFQAHCQGCHQPAKAGRRLRDDLVRPAPRRGRVEGGGVVPGKPDQSHLIDQITPDGGKAEMPKGKPPLSPAELKIVRDWIAQGAVDDTPANARIRYDKDHPPVYRRPPVIGAIDFSPDGIAAGRRRVPRGPALEGRRLRAGRPAGRPLRADRVGPVLAGRDAAWPSPAAAGPDGRGPGLGRGQEEAQPCRSPSPSTPSTARAGRPTARRSPSAAPITASGRSTRRPASRSSSWARTTTGCSTPPSRPTART